MDRQYIRKAFLIVTVVWGLIIFIFEGLNITVSVFIMLDILPLSFLWLVYAGIMQALRTKKRAEEKKLNSLAQKNKQSAIELYEIEKIKALQKQELPYEVLSRMKSSQPKKDLMGAALEEMKKRKSAGMK